MTGRRIRTLGSGPSPTDNRALFSRARKAEHLTQSDVAERMGISQARVSELESADVSSLKVSTLERYAEALGGTFEAIIQIGEKTIRLA